ncbi:MAG: hypothetical protein AAGF96_06155 [Bacteroidota bacterium]
MKLSLVVLLLIPLVMLSQYKKVNHYVFEGKTIEVGHSFKVGPPSGVNGKYVNILTKGNFGSPPIPVETGLEDGVFEIEQIRILKKPVGGLDGANLVFRKRLMVRLKQAVKSGEIRLE